MAFHGSQEDLLALIRRGGGAYPRERMIKPQEALRTHQKPFRWQTQTFHLNIPETAFQAIRQLLDHGLHKNP